MTATYYVTRINASGVGRYEFVRWAEPFRNQLSKVVCRCVHDGFEWSATVNSLLNTSQGCPQCGGVRRWSADERIAQINSLEGITFVRWCGDYRGAHTKCVCQCVKCHSEWTPTVDNLINGGKGCPSCADYGYNPDKSATLYALRSTCGNMVKIGISNNYEQRHSVLIRKTPFRFECVELCHGDGSLIATLEKVLHDLMTPVKFDRPFDGSTEWREWDDRLPMWFEMYRSWS